MSDSISHLDTPKVREFITQLAEQDLPNSQIANRVGEKFGLGTSDRSIRRAKRRWGLAGGLRQTQGEKPRVTTIRKGDDEITEIVGEPTVGDVSPEELIKAHGLNPDDWDVTNVKINRWTAMTGKKRDNELVEMCQITIQLVRRKPAPPFIQAARTDGPSYRKSGAAHSGQENGAKLVVFVGDQQAPFHNEGLHELFCQWLEVNTPEEGILIGDTVDFPDISRHRYNPERTATVQQCVNAGYRVLKDYRESSLDTWWRKMPGNHDERIRNTLIDWATELYGITRAQVEGDEQEPPVLGVEHLLRLDELGIDYVDPDGQYDQAQINVTKYLAARHGWIAVKGAGQSALKTLEHLGYSIAVGHTHRQAIVHQTKHDIDGTPTTLVAVEIGSMCNLDGLGYSVAPDWQNGFATATIWPDGVFKMDLATFFDGTLAWRDQRYGVRT